MNVISVFNSGRSDSKILIDELNKRSIVKDHQNLILVFPDRLAEYQKEPSLFDKISSAIVESYPYEFPIGVVFIRIYLDYMKWKGSLVDGAGNYSYKIRFRTERTKTSYFI